MNGWMDGRTDGWILPEVTFFTHCGGWGREGPGGGGRGEGGARLSVYKLDQCLIEGVTAACGAGGRDVCDISLRPGPGPGVGLISQK